MTICIAALAEDKKKIILAADQMITATIPIAYEFETEDVRKIYFPTENIAILTAGNTLHAFEIVDQLIRDIRSDANVKPEHRRTEYVVERTRKIYQDYRRNLFSKTFLEPRGLNLNSYYDIQQKLFPGVVNKIEHELDSFSIGVEMIVAGSNPGGNCHIYSITHPGISTSHDELGYVAVGSGAAHAMYYLIGSGYKKTFPAKRVEQVVREAKKRSEAAPGVGQETTIITLPKKNRRKLN